MREIKFRAWDKENGMVYEPGYGVMAGTREFRLNQILALPQPTLMQFTELLDKNGKEIYEGDILQMGAYKYKVEWESCRWAFVHMSHRKADEVLDGFYIHSYGTNNSMEVVGNIYENPELLATKEI